MVLRRAVWDDRRVRIRYEDRNRKATMRTIDPLGLVSKAGVWYLIARLSEELEMRSFRVERMRSVDELPTRFERPPEFDLERYWSDTSAQFKQSSPEYFVTLRTDLDAVETVTLYWTSEVVETNADFGLVRVAFPGPEAATFAVLAWGGKVTIVEPLELRELVVARAREALERHAP